MISIQRIREQNLTFGGDLPAPDPKTGITLFGPYSKSLREITVGIIGDATTVDEVRRLLEMCTRRIEAPIDYPLWTQDFPGMRRDSPFSCELIMRPEWCKTLRLEDIERLDGVKGLNRRIGLAVDLFGNEIRKMKEREDSPWVYICAPPRQMMDLCLPSEGDESGKRGKQASADRRKYIQLDRPEGQKSLSAFFPELRQIEEEYLQQVAGDNFHNFLKAKAMMLHIPTQFIRPYTLDKLFGAQKGKVQDIATLAWNLCIGLYYKSGGRPWKFTTIPSGTCFIGISFYREKDAFGGGVGTSLAQVFTPEGEGLILRGDRFNWAKGEEPHLTREGARRLAEKAMKAYVQQVETGPTRVVIHKSSTFKREEREGFKEGIGPQPRHDFVAILERSKKIKLFRAGEQPVLRGTIVRLPDETRLLFTRGYIPYMHVYPGARVPRPLEITFDEISSPHIDICSEILALTRLNWNSSDFNGMLPITLQFSREVGKILREVPPGGAPETRYLFYM